MAWKLSGGLLILITAGGIAAWYTLQGNPASTPTPFAGFPLTPISESRFTGTASCSGRACHGGLEPSEDRSSIQGNEHTIWQVHDRHAEAYSVLFSKRSIQMALADDPSVPANENRRCLVCHVNPAIIDENSETTAAERHAGVGCETCHGAAASWLGPHAAWGSLDAKQKKQQFAKNGMRWLGGPLERAELCVGCHVGWEPVRQVDHDLIAAGHPRLDFELTAFLANMPPHWRGAKDRSDDEAQAWAVGQLVTARSALHLLTQRMDQAEARPWPEFAEYDCFACHHDMNDATWRRKLEHLGKRSPGSMAWNERYLTFLPELVGEDAGKLVADLGRAMARPSPDRRQISDLCAQLESLLKDPISKGVQSGVERRVLQSLVNKPDHFAASWDAAAQAYLAADALGRSSGHADPDPALRELGQLLAFPPGTDSPVRFRATADLDGQLKGLIRRAGQAALRDVKP